MKFNLNVLNFIIEGFSFAPIDDLYINIRVSKPRHDLDNEKISKSKMYKLDDVIPGIDDEEEVRPGYFTTKYFPETIYRSEPNRRTHMENLREK